MQKSIYSSINVSDLKCNYIVNPLGVETPKPRLSWVLNSDKRNQYQKAYRIIISSNSYLLDQEKGDLWDSGKVISDKSIHISYEGENLQSRQKVFWKVSVWDKNNFQSEWSEASTFEMGLLNEDDWVAKWIGSPSGGTEVDRNVPAPLLRKSLNIEKKVLSARIYICGLGYYELYINGAKIGDDVLSPAFTRYDKTVLYNTYDITNELKEGENAIGSILGNGWYNCFTSEVWNFRQAPWRHQPKLLLQAHIVFEDGEELIIKSDRSWKIADSPIVFDGLRNGEYYDARKEKNGWDKPGYDDRSWTKVNIIRSPGGVLKSSQMTPIKIVNTIKPVALMEAKPGVWVYDLGQNISGWAQIRVSGSEGAEVILKYSERVNNDGTIDTSNIDGFIKSGEFQTDKYILKGSGLEMWEPRFTYHGFRYVQVVGFPGTPTLDNLSGRVVHTAFSETGSFECSNELLNSIQSCAIRSTLTNYHGIPTDCPHREKNGWTGDALLSAEQVLLNFNPQTAYMKWLNDFKDVQRISGQLPGIVPTGGWGYNWGSGPAWDSTMILIPWYIYEYSGDISILEEMYCNMKKYVDYMLSMSDEYMVDFGLGDWCPPTGGSDHKCPSVVTDTAYFFVDADIVAKIAGLLGKNKDVEKYGKLAQDIRDAFRDNFINVKTGIVEGNCQTSLSCVLYQGLVEDNEKEAVIKNLVNQVKEQSYHIDCGILGAKYLLHALTVSGRADLAYIIATQKTFPSWGYWIEQGATTLWENWNGEASQNHHMFSDISAWFYKGLAGINPDVNEPGFKHIVFRPNPVPGLKWVYARHQSMYGRIECRWEVEIDHLSVKVNIPVNCHATLYLPDEYIDVIETDREKYDEILINTNENGLIMLEFGSGKYQIKAKKSVI